MTKRKGLLAVRESVTDVRTVPCPGSVTALHRQVLVTCRVTLASISLGAKLINVG